MVCHGPSIHYHLKRLRFQRIQTRLAIVWSTDFYLSPWFCIKTRLRHLQPWVAIRQPNNTFGGITGAGAEDAWYGTSREEEHSLSFKLPFVAGVVDLMKCFDQIIRFPLYIMLHLAGLSHGVLAASVRFQENLEIRHIISDSVGVGHRHACGIPQGCPLSMVFISLLLRAWMQQMKACPVHSKPKFPLAL